MNANDRLRHLLLMAALAFVPCAALAQIRVSEIMYDVEGTDTGREWIEVYNDGNSTVDIADYRVFEGGTNHKLTSIQGSTLLSQGAAAVIADDAEKFLADWPSFSGTLFDTSFTSGLSNSGETITIRDGQLADEDSVTYTADLGAQGDGMSLARTAGGSFSPAAPTPGQYGAASSGGSDTGQPDTSEAPSGADAGVHVSSTFTALNGKRIEVEADVQREVIVGAGARFSAIVYGTAGELVQDPRIIWNFGNGESEEGEAVLATYRYPGRYSASVTGVSGELSATERFVVEAVPANLALRTETDGSVSVLNQGARDVDISYFSVARAGVSFAFPHGTVILAGEGIRLPPHVTDLPAEGEAVLRYPNGEAAAASTPALVRIFASQEQKAATGQASAAAPARQRPAHEAVQPTGGEDASYALASVAQAAEHEQSNIPQQGRGYGIVPWLLGAIAIAAVAGGAVILLQQRAPVAEQNAAASEADSYEIIE